FGCERVKQDRKQRGQQEETRQQRQAGLKTAAVLSHCRLPIYDCQLPSTEVAAHPCSQNRQSEIGNRNHLNWPAYHSTRCTPNSSEKIAPIPRKIPNGNSICMFRSRCRAINTIPMIEPVNTPTK